MIIIKKVSQNLNLEKKNIQRETEIKGLIVSILNTTLEEIGEIEVLGGMTNKNFLVSVCNKKYILRVAGAGTKDIINRCSEKINTLKASVFGIAKDLIYFNEENGIKISEYIEKTETLTRKTSKEKKNLLLTSKLLKKLHTENIKFENTFNVFDEIEKYENLIKNKNILYEKYTNYLENRKFIFSLKNILENIGITITACHNDAVPENFIKIKEKDIFLIDWEYSGMNDPMWDLATHSLESNLTLYEEKIFLQSYFDSDIKEENILRIEIYKILQDFLWSIWTILKEENGDDFGLYGINRYNRSISKLKENFEFKK